ncbi:MAG: hypothetical protein ACHREM_31520, partial [Polyangiales bacterium]
MAPKGKVRVSQSAIAKEEATKIAATLKALGLGKEITAQQRRTLISGNAVSAAFIELTAQASEALGADLGVKSFSADDVRTAIAFRAAQRPVVEAAQTLMRALEDRLLIRYGAAGTAALTVYAQLKVLARGPNGDPRAKKAVKALAEEFRSYRQQQHAQKTAGRAANKEKRTANSAAKQAAKAARA